MYYTAQIIINKIPRTILVCKSPEPVAFPDPSYHKQTTELGDRAVSTVYTTEPYIYRQLYESGYYYYWFILKKINETTVLLPEEISNRISQTESQLNAMFGTTEPEQSIAVAAQLNMAVRLVAEQQTDEDAILSMADLYEAWKPDITYKPDKIISYGKDALGDTQLYKVVQEHTSQSEWTPDKTPALYTPIGLAENGLPVWRQPTGAHDAYNEGDQCVYNGYVWTSKINGNTTVPGSDDRWWTKGDAVGEPEPEPSDIPDWDSVEVGYAFKTGTQFTYKGKTYNVLRDLTKTPGWEPPALLGDYYEEA